MYLYTLSPFSLSHHAARPAFCRVDLVTTNSHGLHRVVTISAALASLMEGK